MNYFNVIFILIVLFHTGVQSQTLGTNATKCTREQGGDVTICLEPMIQLSEVISARVPIVNRILFPLYNFQKSDIQQICRVWTLLHETCLTAELQRRCSSHALLQILKSLFGYSCSSQTTGRFFDTYQCVKDSIADEPKCLERILVPEDVAQRPKSKCDPIPPFYQCVKKSVIRRCGLNGLESLYSTLATFGCTNLGTKHEDDQKNARAKLPKSGGNIRRRNLKSTQTKQSEINSVTTHESAQKSSRNIKLVNSINLGEEDSVVQPEDLKVANKIADTNVPSKSTDHRSQRTSGKQFIKINSNRQSTLSVRKFSKTQLSKSKIRESLPVAPVHQPVALKESSRDKSNRETDGKLDKARAELTISTDLDENYFNSKELDRILGARAHSQARSDSRSIASMASTGQQAASLKRLNSRINNQVEDENYFLVYAGHTAYNPSATGQGLTSENCSASVRTRTRTCLQPVMRQWHSLATAPSSLLANVTFPLYLMHRSQLLELCDAYASSFLDCDLNDFLACAATDPVVGFADAMFGFACGNAVEFFRSYDCLSVIAQDAGTEPCREAIRLKPTTSEQPVSLDFAARCKGIRDFSTCITDTVEAICPAKALDVFKESIRYYGCIDDL